MVDMDRRFEFDIFKIDENDIDEEFENYFDNLSAEDKAEIIRLRPELADGLGYIPPIVKTDIDKADTEEGIDTVDPLNTHDEYSAIRNNPYSSMADIDAALKDKTSPLEVLVIPDNTTRCAVHKMPYQKNRFDIMLI